MEPFFQVIIFVCYFYTEQLKAKKPINFLGTALVFSQIYSIFTSQDKDAQTRDSLTYMGILFGFAGTVTIATIVCNYSFSLVGARLEYLKILHLKITQNF